MPDARVHLRQLPDRAVHHQAGMRVSRVASQLPGFLEGSEGAAPVARMIVTEAQIELQRGIPVGFRVRLDECQQRPGVVGIVALRAGLGGGIMERGKCLF